MGIDSGINLMDFYSRLGTIAVILVLGFILGKFKLISAKTNKDLVNLLESVDQKIEDLVNTREKINGKVRSLTKRSKNNGR